MNVYKCLCPMKMKCSMANEICLQAKFAFNFADLKNICFEVV